MIMNNKAIKCLQVTRIIPSFPYVKYFIYLVKKLFILKKNSVRLVYFLNGQFPSRSYNNFLILYIKHS